MEQLLSAGADPDLRNKDGNYPLFELVSGRREKNDDDAAHYLEILLQYEANADTIVKIDIEEETPLSAAIKANNTQLAQILISQNLNLNIPIRTSSSTLTPLGAAVRKVENILLHSLLLTVKKPFFC